MKAVFENIVEIYKLYLQKILNCIILVWQRLTALGNIGKQLLSGGPQAINLFKQVKIYMRSFS